MKYILLVIIVCICTDCTAQGDFMMLRKKNTIVENYFEGTYLQCQLVSGQWLEGRIKKIIKDSLFVEQMSVRQVANYWGLPTMDTARFGLIKLSINDIHALPIKEKGVGIVKDGSLFKLGAAAYIALNIFNGLVLKGENVASTQSLTGLGIAACVYIIGEILHRNHPSSIVLGKKYKLSTTALVPIN